MPAVAHTRIAAESGGPRPHAIVLLDKLNEIFPIRQPKRRRHSCPSHTVILYVCYKLQVTVGVLNTASRGGAEAL